MPGHGHSVLHEMPYIWPYTAAINETDGTLHMGLFYIGWIRRIFWKSHSVLYLLNIWLKIYKWMTDFLDIFISKTYFVPLSMLIYDTFPDVERTFRLHSQNSKGHIEQYFHLFLFPGEKFTFDLGKIYISSILRTLESDGWIQTNGKVFHLFSQMFMPTFLE